MDKKDFIIILMVIIIVVGVGIYSLNLIDFNAEPETKVYDFEDFTMNVSTNSNFTKSIIPMEGYDYEIISFIDNKTDITITYTPIEDTFLKFAMLFVDEQNAKQYQQIPTNGTAIDGVKLYTFHDPNGNHTKYLATYETQSLYIQVTSDNLEELIQMMNSIRIK